MPVLVQIPENPNCRAVDGHVFACRTPARIVTHIRLELAGNNEWCAITGLDDSGIPCPATACIVEDSGDGACYLVVGGPWGIRLKSETDGGPWTLDSSGQWGEPFLLLGGDGADMRFQT